MTYEELKTLSLKHHTQHVTGAQAKSLGERIYLVMVNGSQYWGQRGLERLKYMRDTGLYDVHPDDGHNGICVCGYIGNKGNRITLFIK